MPDELLWKKIMRFMRKKAGSCHLPTYLRSINNQFEAILVYAENFYRLKGSL